MENSIETNESSKFVPDTTGIIPDNEEFKILYAFDPIKNQILEVAFTRNLPDYKIKIQGTTSTNFFRHY